MQTNWKQIRELFNTALQACEAYENLGLQEGDRDRKLSNDEGTLGDLLISARTLPENMAYEVIRARHRGGLDNPYVSELSRVIRATAELAAELVVLQPPARLATKARSVQSEAVAGEVDGQIEALLDWYRSIYLVEMRRLEKSERKFIN